MCVYVFTPIHREGFVFLDHGEYQGQIKDAVLKIFLSSAKFLHRYFKMKHQVLLTSDFILFPN